MFARLRIGALFHTSCQLVIAIFLLHADPRTCCGQTESTDVALVEKLGGTVFRNSDGRVVGISCVAKGTRDIFFDDNDIESIDFSVFLELIDVTIYSRKITDRSLIQLQKTKGQLEWLAIAGGRFTDKEMAKLLRSQPSLRSIRLLECNITNKTLEPIGEFEDLKFLSLTGTKITNDGLRHLTKITSLWSLDLNKTGITDAGLASVREITSLRGLGLASTPITDAGFQELRKLKNLRTLNIESTKITADAVNTLKTSLPQVEIIR